MRRIWLFAFYVFFFAGIAFATPFFVLYFQSIGFTGTQIGLLTGMAPLITLVSAPLWTGLADATRGHRLIMSLAILTSVIMMSVFPLFSTFAPILLIAVAFNTFFAPIPSFADNVTMSMLADQKALYGRIRVGGTIGFGVAALMAGALVQKYGLRWAFWGCAALMSLAFFVSQKLTHGQAKAGASPRGGVRAMLTSRRWIPFLIVAFAGGLGLSAVNTYLFPYLKELGAKESIMGLSLALGTLSEIPVLFFGNRLIRRFKPYRLLVLASVVTGVRLLLFAASGKLGFVLGLQLLSGLTFPVLWIAGVAYADEHAPAGMSATAQGLLNAMVFGCGSAVGGFIGGPLLEGLGGRGLYLVFGVVVLATVAVAVLMQRRLPAEHGASSDGTMH